MVAAKGLRHQSAQGGVCAVVTTRTQVAQHLARQLAPTQVAIAPNAVIQGHVDKGKKRDNRAGWRARKGKQKQEQQQRSQASQAGEQQQQQRFQADGQQQQRFGAVEEQ
ncbi:MAG: hypothetical protein LQ351_006249 [Letrouitia transgressa]|nr:MAG: hypothetical protein LQ351_006249 [Letrouitia transgressa]